VCLLRPLKTCSIRVDQYLYILEGLASMLAGGVRRLGWMTDSRVGAFSQLLQLLKAIEMSLPVHCSVSCVFLVLFEACLGGKDSIMRHGRRLLPQRVPRIE